jgi:hypothetical protein
MARYFYYCLTVTVLFLWGAPSDERTGLSFVYAASPCQRSLSRVRVSWDSRIYFTVSDLRLPFSSSPTTRRVTVEVFDPASTRVTRLILSAGLGSLLYRLGADPTENTAPQEFLHYCYGRLPSNSPDIVDMFILSAGTCLRSRCSETVVAY